MSSLKKKKKKKKKQQARKNKSRIPPKRKTYMPAVYLRSYPARSLLLWRVLRLAGLESVFYDWFFSILWLVLLFLLVCQMETSLYSMMVAVHCRSSRLQRVFETCVVWPNSLGEPLIEGAHYCRCSADWLPVPLGHCSVSPMQSLEHRW